MKVDNADHDNHSEAREVLEQLESWLEGPVTILGLAWLALLVVELIWGLNSHLQTIVLVIWGIFIVDFVVRLVLAPEKVRFLRTNWLTVISLVVPGFRILRAARFARVLRASRTIRSLNLVKVVGSLNRGMRSLRVSMGRRGFDYVIVLTVLVTIAGAAGMVALESGQSSGFDHYPDALWRVAMIMTTLGADAQPVTGEGRILQLFLALYAFAVFGYVTASLATLFIGQDAELLASTERDETLRELRTEMQEIKEMLQESRAGLSGPSPSAPFFEGNR